MTDPLRRRSLWFASAASAVLLTAACGGTTIDDAQDDGGAGPTGTADPNAEIPEGLAIDFLPKQLNNPFFDLVNEGGFAAVEELGGEATERGGTEATADSQVEYVNAASQAGSDVIVIAANDPDAVCPALNEARDNGAAIVGYDSDANCTDVFVNQSTNELIGRALADMISDELGGEGTFAVLSATPNATNQNAWIAELEEILQEDDYADLELVDTVYGNDDDLESFQEMQGLVQAHPDLDGVVSPTTVGLAAAARYVSDSEYQGELAVTGLGTPNQMREFVHDGTVGQFALWNPNDLGYLSGYTGAALQAGQITGAAGETFTAGELGEFTFETDGEVVLGPPMVFDADNVDDFDF
ncbi:rhamnose ABC transporter substrate-binding protein [Nocardiopsis terrae]|uniref:Rhamnose transport system substrate-binding protein n=1 Tax=Nocardiopsis terrae TaxID=372655 RepID=A0ABR9HI54_9ACTN|nr:rhamnose ABC transporter substrate-binding protein [Nocardiopsis terrae]MBE1458683.1 rhamnose transport system substrate-binding protein [Nocardiopsis terrae]GHC79078.1 rhamnose ABC transporter substrate-binding protein [Nocardiopsis terrae]